MNERRASCACCSFLGKNGLFLPWGDTSDVAAYSAAAADVMSPSDAWQAILTARAGLTQQHQLQQQIALVDTHGHPHLERSVQYALKDPDKISSDKDQTINVVVSITCAVSPLDWNDALEYASRSQHVLPALGVHPWYVDEIIMEEYIFGKTSDANTNSETTTSTDESTPSNTNNDIEQYLKWEWLSELETNLSHHPNLIVGEIGLCKMARFVREFPKSLGGKATALQLQKIVFKKQMAAAAKWRRPVTVHCVNAHGLLLDTLKELLNEARESCIIDENVDKTSDSTQNNIRNALPPAIALHSFTGTAHHVQQILDFEKSILCSNSVEAEGKRQRGKLKRQQRKQEANSDGSDILFYFGFSHSVNFIMCTSEKAKRKGIEAVQAIPSARLLVESDVHASVDVTLGTAGAAAYVSWARGESLESVAECSTRNGLRFVSSLSSRPVG